ncbi:hypothetical protein [Pseudanabaena sp. FACHB-2040]|uniref:hypothetical protein n=1 Tax=Pseudanabaena sp. FACHB-2040 TaxID=2692859 RepID=UPI001684446B|nr:hypothetical protein [Pseudanabaena sp. FACHB-2040]MBD0268044.1 hypothetical protein [Cyanobacteria bacterium Co-bin8]MBD2258313.1 hypothetical protein [Pseudanabaena sp. FACHB-2040]
MPAKGRVDVRVKFSGVPLAGPGSKGFTKIEVFCDGYVVIAEIRTKTFQRFLETARDLGDWEGAVSGEFHHFQGHQIVLSNAGLQCYEKKSKPFNEKQTRAFGY